jgi:hypothetical protein
MKLIRIYILKIEDCLVFLYNVVQFAREFTDKSIQHFAYDILIEVLLFVQP